MPILFSAPTPLITNTLAIPPRKGMFYGIALTSLHRLGHRSSSSGRDHSGLKPGVLDYPSKPQIATTR